MKDNPELHRIIEVLLFVSDIPLSVQEISEILCDFSREEIVSAIDSVVQDYRSEDRSLQLIEVAGGYQFTTKPRYHRWIQELKRQRRERQLTGAALETLAIIAYKQPIPRAEIERIRGVNVDGVLQNLLRRNMVRIMGRDKGLGRALLYGTTKEFLVHFGLNDIKELPSVEEIKQLFKPVDEVVSAAEDDGEYHPQVQISS